MDAQEVTDHPKRRCDLAVELLADADTGQLAAHLRRCRDCADTVWRLRADPAVGPDLELRLLRAFRRWRAGGA